VAGDVAGDVGGTVREHGRDRVDAGCFRSAMGAFATGVTVVTVAGPDGSRYGMTVNAFASVSLDPPLVLVCLARSGRGHDLVREAGVLTVNVLADDQQHLSRRFADRRRAVDEAMFAGIAVRPGSTGCPVLPDAAASFDCRVQRIVDAGDHVIVLGEVVALRHRPERAPLVFHAAGYRELAADPSAGAPARLRAV
jgi:flavin reductase (DIM6/NTAB) family NADH-FMN oxidoreductase RutF